MTMQEGTVKFFNETKGFGFITPSAGGADIFVHVSGLYDEIRENDKVSFEVQNGKKGLNAVNVKVI
ncbi:MAG: cold-shock protein [Phycisphaerales bacterium]|nr:cold-shock protein [Phycisphaerales bacterium]